jgi:hypothetical protein
MKESPIFTKLFDFVTWVIPLTLKFPRSHRFVVAEALQRVTLASQEAAIRAGHGATPADVATHLNEVALNLSLIRFYLRLAVQLTLITVKQHEFASERLTEIGRLLEAWRKVVAAKTVVAGAMAD